MNRDRGSGYQVRTSDVADNGDEKTGVELLVLAVATSDVAELDPVSIDREIRTLPGVTRVLRSFSAEAVVVK